ncbi:hypothetical protein TA17A_80 [Mycobacterium phage TA17A]|uniref:Uncharacterized protein n=1 Tax=Mycobacterium phage TA17A TaxID=2928684 RepID=S5VZ79_9CAUD|nr:hypothetical protein FPF50_gp80 [Mycobacterium phage TA17A]AGS81479.1 hypothetical protein TA17A_80 [Mycobacterium phage TA17A]
MAALRRQCRHRPVMLNLYGGTHPPGKEPVSLYTVITTVADATSHEVYSTHVELAEACDAVAEMVDELEAEEVRTALPADIAAVDIDGESVSGTWYATHRGEFLVAIFKS